MKMILGMFLCMALPALYGQEFQQLLPNSENLVHHQNYSFSYSEEHEQAEWVMYELTAAEAQGGWKRTNNFRSDHSIGSGSAGLDDYKGSGYDRGHLAPAGDMGFSATAMSESFYFSNICPQDPSFNRGIWRRLESLFRAWALDDGELYIVTGPLLTRTKGSIGQNGVSVPAYFYKVALDLDSDGARSIAFILPNTGGSGELKRYVVSIDSLERLTGIDFFPGLPDSLENELEYTTTGMWDFDLTAAPSSKHSSATASVRCGGTTQSGKQCQRSTKETNGFCWQHQQQVSGDRTSERESNTATQCKGTTQSGRRCRRTTKNASGFCWQHE